MKRDSTAKTSKKPKTPPVNKDPTAERLDTKNYSKNVFVLIDESHRSNYSICSLISALLSNPSVSPSAAGAAEGKNE